MEKRKSIQPNKDVRTPNTTDERTGLVNPEAKYFEKRFRWAMVWEFIRTIPHYVRSLLEL